MSRRKEVQENPIGLRLEPVAMYICTVSVYMFPNFAIYIKG